MRATRMRVTPEGRTDLWLVTPDEVVTWLEANKTEELAWHSMIPTNGMLLGADWNHDAVIDLVRKPGVRLAINTDIASCMRHQLAIADDDEGRLTVFDIGEITRTDITVLTTT